MAQNVRIQWPAPSHDEISQEIQQAGQIASDDQISRIQKIYSEFGPRKDLLLTSGIEAYYALQEMQNCYITANSMAVILLAQAFIEHSLASLLIITGQEDIAEIGFAKIINHAKKIERISPELFECFDQLRKIRNSYVHPKVGLKPGSSMQRFLDSGLNDPRDLIDEEAAFAIETVVDFLRYSSPNWRPAK